MRDEEQILTSERSADDAGAEAQTTAAIAGALRQSRREREWGLGDGRRVEHIRVIVGEDDPHGREAHLDPPGDYPVFNPRFLCVLFMDFRPDWTLAINHASYDFVPDQDPAVSEAGRLAKAVAVIDGKIRSGGDLADVPHHRPYAWRYPALHQPGRTHDSTTFSDFKFKSPTEIFLFMNNPNVVLGPSARLIRFTRYGSLGSSAGEMNENQSFFRAREVTGAQLGVLNNRGKLIRLENHARVDPMTSTDVRDQSYSMNIRLGINGGGAGIIPVIIDPDTGNGQGNEP